MTSATLVSSVPQFSGNPGLSRSPMPGISSTRFKTSRVRASFNEMYSRLDAPEPPGKPAVMEAS